MIARMIISLSLSVLIVSLRKSVVVVVIATAVSRHAEDKVGDYEDRHCNHGFRFIRRGSGFLTFMQPLTKQWKI